MPADYPTLAAAVSWLNNQTINDNYVINVSASHTESVTAPILFTATGSAEFSLTIQKYGEGANPLVTRTDTGTISTTTIGGSGDSVIRMEGSDYVTWDGIDVAANESTIEYGYLTFKPNGTDGCQHDTIQNCTVTMNKGSSACVTGIYIGNGTTLPNGGLGVTVTADSGRNQFITISGVTVQNVHAGIFCRGSSTTGYPDTDITIGEAGAPNLIHNFGGGRSTMTYGIYFNYCTNPTASYNTIDNAGGGGTPHTNTLYGIYFSGGTGGVLNANHNTITMAVSATNAVVNYIYNGSACTSESYTDNSFAAGTMAFTGNVYLIYSSNGTPDKTASNNQICGNITRTGSSGSFYGYYNYGTSTGGMETITNNNFSNVVLSGTSIFYGINTNAAAVRDQLCANNTISNITCGSGPNFCISLQTSNVQVYNNSIHDITAGGDIYGIRCGGISEVHDNQIYNFTTGTSLCGMFQTGGTINNYRNTIYNFTSTGSDQVVYGMYIANDTSSNIYNNMIYGLQAPGYLTVSIPVIRGIQIAGGTATEFHYNTIYLNHHGATAYFSAAGICFGGGTADDLRNNIVVNKCIPGTNGYSTALSSNVNLSTCIGPNSDCNIYFADKMLELNGSIINDLDRYKTLLINREQHSYWEDVPFVSTGGEVDLHIQPGVPTNVEGNALVLAGFDTDYDNQTRNAHRPDIGADEGHFTAMDTSEDILIDDDDLTPLPDGVTVTPGGSVPSDLLGADSGFPAQIYTITATGTRNIKIFKPAGWGSDWFCWIILGTQLLQGSNPISTTTSSWAFEYVDFDAKGTATVLINDNQTLPVELSSFTATVSSDLYVTLKWVAESETNHAGYNLYRGESAELGSALRLNTQIIDHGTANGTQVSYVYSDFEAYNNMQYYYWLESVSLNGSSQYFGPINVVIGNLADEPEQPEIQLSTKLMSAFPNPFNPNTNLRYSLKEAGKVKIEVLNLKGQLIRSFNVNHDSPGFYQLAWDGRDMDGRLVSSGVYLCRMSSGKYISTRKMILAK